MEETRCIQYIKKFLIINTILIILINTIFFSSNYVLITHDIGELHENLTDINNILYNKIIVPQNIEEKIFKLIFAKFYRKNNTISTNLSKLE
jgi:hypothetical protein